MNEQRSSLSYFDSIPRRDSCVLIKAHIFNQEYRSPGNLGSQILHCQLSTILNTHSAQFRVAVKCGFRTVDSKLLAVCIELLPCQFTSTLDVCLVGQTFGNLTARADFTSPTVTSLNDLPGIWTVYGSPRATAGGFPAAETVMETIARGG